MDNMDELVSKLCNTSITGDIDTPIITNNNNNILPATFSHISDMTNNINVTNTKDDNDLLVEKEVLDACKETAKSFRSSVADRSNRTMLIGLLRAKEDKPLLIQRVKQVLNADPKLGVCRFDLAGTGVPDGFTPLHVLSSNGNLYLLKIFIEIGLQQSISLGLGVGKPLISAWTVDLQGIYIVVGINISALYILSIE